MKAGGHNLAQHQLARLSAVLLLAHLNFSCKLKSGNQDDPSDLLNHSSPRNKGLALIEKKELYARPAVHAVRLDDIEFRVNALRVGEQIFLRYETPILSFEMPKDADYVDILRCPSNVIIFGGADDIDHVETGAKSGAAETKIFQRNNFWEVAAQTSGCVLAASSYTDVSFEDTSAPSGKYHYYMRACVDQHRLIATDKFTSANCSRQVTRTPEHQHTNKRSRIELEALLEATQLRSKIDTIGRQIIEKTSLLNDQLYDCQQRHNKRVLDYSKKTGIATILRIGAVALPALGMHVVGAFTKRSNSTLSFEGSKRGLRDTFSNFEEAVNKKNSPQIQADGTLLKQRVNSHVDGLNVELDRLRADKIRVGNSSPSTLNSLDKQLATRQTELNNLKSIKDELGATDFNNADAAKSFYAQHADNLRNIVADEKSSLASSAATFVAHTGLAAGASAFLGSVFAAGSQTIPGYPRDAELCYNRKNETKISQQSPSGSGDDRPSTALICSCADAMATQIDLSTLATDLQQQTELYQAQLDTSHLAREEKDNSASVVPKTTKK